MSSNRWRTAALDFGAVRIDQSEITAAARQLQSAVITTPVLPLNELSADLDLEVFAKAENLQRTGSFKFRGAMLAMQALTPELRRRGVITYSAGNHGRGVAEAARTFGVRAVVVMPEDAASVKIDGVKRAGGEVRLVGQTLQERRHDAEALAAREGLAVIPPFDDLQVILGQSTIGTEVLTQLPEIDAILVPIGGGGLISGIALAVKSVKPDVELVGVEPEGKAVAFTSMQEGERIRIDDVQTVAESLRSSEIGQLNWAIVRPLVDSVVLVSDAALLQSARLMALDYKLVVEPAGVAGIAALREGWRPSRPGARRVAVILSGGNVDPAEQSAQPTASIE